MRRSKNYLRLYVKLTVFNVFKGEIFEISKLGSTNPMKLLLSQMDITEANVLNSYVFGAVVLHSI